MTKPLRVSWSAIRTHEECKERSYLVREGKRSKVSNIRNFWPGTVVDHIMRIWLDNPLHTPGQMVELVTEVMDRSEAEEKDKGNIVRFRNAQDRSDVQRFCTELVTRLEPLLAQHVLPYTYEHGKWFKVPMNVAHNGEYREIVLTGEMDLLVNNGGPVVWDLKGTADDQYWRKVVAQLTFYDLAIWASSGVKTRFTGLIQPMCTEQVKAWEITDEARANLLGRIERYCADVWAAKRECTTDTSKCHWCDVRHACQRFSTDRMNVFGDLADGLRHAAGDPA